MNNLRDLLEPIAAWFRGLNVPEPIVHWGHPLMMGIVIFVMGTFVAISGWRSRLTTDEKKKSEQAIAHRTLAPWMFLFIAAGYTGGLLSLVMQKQPILESPHFITGSAVVVLLALNGLISLSGFLGNKTSLRAVHAYLGSITIAMMFIHAFLGLQLGLSI